MEDDLKLLGNGRRPQDTHQHTNIKPPQAHFIVHTVHDSTMPKFKINITNINAMLFCTMKITRCFMAKSDLNQGH